MNFGIIVLIVAGIVYLSGVYLLHKNRNNKYIHLIGLIISVLGLILTIGSRFYYDDYSISNTLLVILFSLSIVIKIGTMRYNRFKQKQE